MFGYRPQLGSKGLFQVWKADTMPPSPQTPSSSNTAIPYPAAQDQGLLDQGPLKEAYSLGYKKSNFRFQFY